MKIQSIITLTATFAFALTLGIANTTEASHSWGKYHWDLSTADTISNPLELGDNLSGGWSTFLTSASVDWNPSVLKNEVVIGSSNVNCDPTLGQVEVCSNTYGDNGWLGIAQIWTYRGKDKDHIAQAIVKVNDTYFNLPRYDSDAWRQFVMCQEVGHTFGLDHQDEDFENQNIGTCMDYTGDPSRDDGAGDNLHPNKHDLDQMQDIYAHLNESSNGNPGNGNGGGNGKGKNKVDLPSVALDASEWGMAVSQDTKGRDAEFVRNFGNGARVITHVLWAE